jgi:hypothetical protein
MEPNWSKGGTFVFNVSLIIAFVSISAVLSPRMFSRNNLLDLRDSGKVNGIVLLGFNASDADLLPPGVNVISLLFFGCVTIS